MKIVLRMLTKSLSMLEDSREDIGHFWGLDARRNVMGTRTDKPDGERDWTAGSMVLDFVESEHSVVRASSAIERGELRNKGKR